MGMTLAQIRAWTASHAKAERERARQMLTVIRAAISAEPDEIEAMFAPRASGADAMARDTAATDELLKTFNVTEVPNA